jgi:hypothetical protein
MEVREAKKLKLGDKVIFHGMSNGHEGGDTEYTVKATTSNIHKNHQGIEHVWIGTKEGPVVPSNRCSEP